MASACVQRLHNSSTAAAQHQPGCLSRPQSADDTGCALKGGLPCGDLQVKRWARQYHLSFQGDAQPLREVLALIDWLQDHIPANDDASASRLSHGDFRCDQIT